jgi:hypothetical protein
MRNAKWKAANYFEEKVKNRELTWMRSGKEIGQQTGTSLHYAQSLLALGVWIFSGAWGSEVRTSFVEDPPIA